MTLASRTALVSIAVVLCLPTVASAAVIKEQPLFDQTERLNGDSPMFFSGASGRTPSLVSLFSATGTVRTATIRYDLLGDTTNYGLFASLYECPLHLGDELPLCHTIASQDASLGWDGTYLHPNYPNGGELSIDFTSAHRYGPVPADFTDGVPLDPQRGYRLEVVLSPNNFTADISGTRFSNLDGFYPFYRLEGDVPTSTPATTTPPVCTENCNSNVMFLPGIEGSRLYDTDDGETKLWESSNDTNARQLKMAIDGASIRQDVYTRDIIDSVGLIRIYQPLISELNELKTSGEISDWRAIPYDWRLSLDQIISSGAQNGANISYLSATGTPYIMQSLKQLASSSRTQKVTIVAHSNGGLVLKALLISHPELSQYIDRIILVAVPQLGTPQAVEGILSGRDEAIPFFLRAATIRSLAQNMPMSYNLLPSDNYFIYLDDPVISFDPATMQDWIAKYGTTNVHSVDRLSAFLLDTDHVKVPTPDDVNLIDPIDVNTTLFNSSMTQHNSLDTWAAPAGIQVIEVAGWGRETLSGITYRRDEQNVCIAQTPNGNCAAYTSVPSKLTFKPSYVIDGDGTVVGPSALWTNQSGVSKFWLNLQPNGLSHPDIFKSTSLLNFIGNTVTGSNDATPLISSVAPSSQLTNRLHFVLHSPLTLGFIDDQGKYTGSTATSSVSDIPDVYFERLGEVQWLSVPKSLSGQLIMRGTGAGSFSLDIDDINGDSGVISTSYLGVPSASSTVVTMTINPSISPSANGVLNIDFNGDGAVEQSLPAKAGGNVTPDFKAPEAVITVSTSTKDILVTGIDESSVTTVTKTATTTVITDEAGNKTTLFFQKRFSGNLLTFAKLTGINYGTSTTPLPSSFLYVWDSNKIPVSQTVVADKLFVIQAIYNKKKDKTTILVLKKGVPIQTTTLAGLRLIKLTTSKGAIGYSW